MVWRAQFGKRGTVYGCWVSKPGIDVTTASPGQFLVDTSSVVYQSVLKGDALIYTEGQATVPAGTYSTTVALPAAFASFSNVAMIATYYRLSNTGTYSSAINAINTYLSFHVTSGVLYLNVTFTSNGGTGSATLSFQHRAAYTIFRGNF